MKLGFKIVILLLALGTGKGLFAQNNSTYSQLIEEADLYLKAGDTGFARIDYAKAVSMNPSDEYPRLKLAEIDRKAITQRRNDSLFEICLVNAEKYFNAGNFNLAQIEYRRSLELKPESVFIKERLAAISGSVTNTAQSKPDPTLASIRNEPDKTESHMAGPKTNTVNQEIVVEKPIGEPSKKETHTPASKTEIPKTGSAQPSTSPTPLQTALTQADEFLNAKDYENAAQRFQTALSLKPGDKAIKTSLTTTRTLLDKQKKDQKAFSDIILAGEKAATQKNTLQAIGFYEQAALLKPEDVILQSKLITLRDRLNVEQNLEKDFKINLAKADSLLHDNNLPEAKKSYELARSIKPEDKYPQDKLLEINHIEAIAASEKASKYKETLILAESLIKQEDYPGAFQSFKKASELQPQEGYPKQKMTELTTKLKEMESQFKIEYNGYIAEANKAFQARNWDIAMDNYLKALKAKATDSLAGYQISRIVSYMDTKLITTLTPTSSSILEGKEMKLPFKSIEVAKRRNQYMVVRVKNSVAGTPRLYINFGQDAQKNGGIICRNLIKGGQYIDYIVRIANQDRWYRLDNNWISLTVEGGTLEIDNLKICADF